MPYQTILYDVAGAVVTITLNRPDKLNAFNADMHRDLADAIDHVAAQGAAVRCVLLTGAGRGFCAGQDLGQRRGDDVPDLGHTLATTYNPLVRRLRKLPVPIVCAVNGVAAGAGMSIALACDITIAARSATFLQAFARIGLVPDSGSTFFLTHLAGAARARGLAMLADKIGAQQAADWGLIWQAVDDERLMAEANAIAGRLAAMPPKALGFIKRALDAAETSALERQLDLEADLQGQAGRTEDYREGVAAFFEKRTPQFKGR